MNPTCIFCKIVRGELPSTKVAEGENFVAILDIHPVHPGHTLIIPKAHHENIFDLPPELLASLMKEVQRIARGVKDATTADGINIMMNNLRASGQLVDHAHIHIIPRYADDGLRHWPNKEVSSEQLAEVGKQISTLL